MSLDQRQAGRQLRGLLPMFLLLVPMTMGLRPCENLGVPGDSGSGGDVSTTDGGTIDDEAICGTRGAEPCPLGQFCAYPENAQCGQTDAPGTCQPMPELCTEQYEPVCGCDGQTYSNACTANSNGVSVASEGECENESAPCGGLLGYQCDEGEFCDYRPGDFCGAADATGLCKPIPEICTDVFKPVCGCDGNTYGNACEANGRGVSVASEGPCEGGGEGPGDGEVCGGLLGQGCGEDEYCAYPESAQCGAADQTGRCATRPEACTQQYDPVCGCDGETHGNACMAAAAGVSVASRGECEAPAEGCDYNGQPYPPSATLPSADGCNTCTCTEGGAIACTERACLPTGGTGDCGGLQGLACDEGEYCNYPISAQCGAADQMGNCSPLPGACTREYRPVCGCDGQTYSNACTAATAGVSVASEGACQQR